MKHYHRMNYKLISSFLYLLLSSVTYCSSLEVTFFDVGQGNGTLVTCGSLPPLLVDCGSSSHSYRGVNFKEQQQSKIAAALKASPSSTFFLVVSHPDEDHYNWLTEVLSDAEKNGRSIEKAWLGGAENHYGSTKKLIQTLQGNLGSGYASKVTFPTVTGPTTLPITIYSSTELSYTILPALPCGVDKNESSLVVQILFHGKALVLPGDATAKTFRHIGALLPKKVLIMLASHHGAEPQENAAKADACNDEDLINAIEPELVIFSAGRRADYAHPRYTTIASYAQVQKKLGFKINWHPLFCGMPSLRGIKSQPLILRMSDTYGVLLTQQPVLSTLTQGSISCTITPQHDGSAAIQSVEMDNPATYDSAKKGALLFPLFETTGAFAHAEISAVLLHNLDINDTEENDGMLLIDLLKVLTDKCHHIKTLVLNNNTLEKTATFDHIVALLEKVDIRECELEGPGIAISEDEKTRILRAWNLRGLKLQPTRTTEYASL